MSKKKKEIVAPQEVLEHFIIRARRVQIHSLVQDGSVEKYAKTQMTVSFSTATGVMAVRDLVVPNEEIFESLTTRLRPFILSTESVYLPDVFGAIRSFISGDVLEEEDKNLEKALVSAEQCFEHRFLKQDVETYAVQLLDEERSPKSGYISDVTMAGSWLYMDTVHADPHGKKAEGKMFGYDARYSAASPFFCELAILVVSILNIVKVLADKGYLTISDTACSEPVTYSEAEKRRGEKIVESSLRVFPAGTLPPEGTRLEDIPGGIEATPMVLSLLADPEGRAILTVCQENGDPLELYPAYRILRDDSFVFLVNDVLWLTVSRDIISGRSSVLPLFEAVKGRETEAISFFRDFSFPHYIEVSFNYAGEEHGFMLYFELFSVKEGESMRKGDEKTE